MPVGFAPEAVKAALKDPNLRLFVRQGYVPSNMREQQIIMPVKSEDSYIEDSMSDAELNHGRLGMLGAAGMIAQELATGNTLF